MRQPDRYRYTCARGHYFSGPRPIGECPAYVQGLPCEGEFWQVGVNGGRVRSPAIRVKR